MFSIVSNLNPFTYCHSDEKRVEENNQQLSSPSLFTKACNIFNTYHGHAVSVISVCSHPVAFSCTFVPSFFVAFQGSKMVLQDKKAIVKEIIGSIVEHYVNHSKGVSVEEQVDIAYEDMVKKITTTYSRSELEMLLEWLEIDIPLGNSQDQTDQIIQFLKDNSLVCKEKIKKEVERSIKINTVKNIAWDTVLLRYMPFFASLGYGASTGRELGFRLSVYLYALDV